jgi:hypothetical protein
VRACCCCLQLVTQLRAGQVLAHRHALGVPADACCVPQLPLCCGLQQLERPAARRAVVVGCELQPQAVP